MRRAVVLSLIAIAMVLGGLYYFLYGREFEYRLTEAELQNALSARMPIQKTYLFVIQVTLDQPRVALVEGSDRVNAGLDVLLNLQVPGTAQSLSGSVDASGGVRYEPTEGKFFLTNPTVERLQLEGVPEKYASRASSALTLALGEYYANHPIFTLDTFTAKQAAARLVLKSVVVEEKQVVVKLGIGP